MIISDKKVNFSKQFFFTEVVTAWNFYLIIYDSIIRPKITITFWFEFLTTHAIFQGNSMWIKSLFFSGRSAPQREEKNEKKTPLILSIGEEWVEFHWLAYFQVEKFVLCDGSHSKNEKQCVIHKIDSGWHLMKTVEINRKSLLLLLYFVVMKCKLCFFH